MQSTATVFFFSQSHSETPLPLSLIGSQYHAFYATVGQYGCNFRAVQSEHVSEQIPEENAGMHRNAGGKMAETSLHRTSEAFNDKDMSVENLWSESLTL